jgi:hypothetical protein
MREVIRCHQRSSEAIRGHQRPSEDIHQRTSVDIRYLMREAIRGHQRPSDALRWQSTSLVPLPFEDAPDEGCNQMQSDVISGT